MGAKQFVVQEALDTTLWLALSYSVWFTPHTSRSVCAQVQKIHVWVQLNMFHTASKVLTNVTLLGQSSQGLQVSLARCGDDDLLGSSLNVASRLGLMRYHFSSCLAFSASTKSPVDSITNSTPMSCSFAMQ